MCEEKWVRFPPSALTHRGRCYSFPLLEGWPSFYLQSVTGWVAEMVSRSPQSYAADGYQVSRDAILETY